MDKGAEKSVKAKGGWLALWWIELGLVAGQVAVSVMVMLSLVKMNILATWIMAVTGIGLAVAVVIATVPLCFRKKPLVMIRILGMILSTMCIVGGVFALRYTHSFNVLLDKVSLQPTAVVEGVELEEDAGLDVTKDPFILYISGSDSRISVDDPEARSDVNILIVVNPVRGEMLLVSIPRDTYVQLHGTTGLMDKLTHAGLGMYGPDMSKLTLEDFLGIKIDYTVKVSFDTVVGVVDELGGVEIYSDKNLRLIAESKNKQCDFVIGTQWVDGDCALRFARERKSYSTGDKHRGENQQEVLTGIINKFISSRDYLLRLPEIMNIVADSFETSLPREVITDFLKFQLAENVNWQIESIGLDGVGDLLPTYTYPEMNLWVMLSDEDSLKRVKNKINEYLADEAGAKENETSEEVKSDTSRGVGDGA